MQKIIKISSSYRYCKLADLKSICGIEQTDAHKMLAPVQDIAVSVFLQANLM
jgi:hypothetical protein